MHQIMGEDNKIQGITQEHGVKYIPSWTPYSEMDISADKIRRIKDNAYCRGLITKQKTLLFTDVPRIDAFDANNDPAEDLQKRLTELFMDNPEVNLGMVVDQLFVDRLLYGASIYNWVWKKDGGEIVLKKLRHLPSFTFSQIPTGLGSTKIYSRILQGIVLDPATEEIQFNQLQDANKTMTVKLETNDIFFVKDESDEELAGTPIILPLIPFFEMMNYTWNAEMQVVNRVGAPIFFIKITDPQPAKASNGGISDIDYTNLILQNWGKDNAYPLRPNMEIEVPAIHEGNVNVDAIEALHYVMIDYFSPASFVTRTGGSLIGGSNTTEGELMVNYIKGIHRGIENACNRLLKYYLDANGYTEKGFSAKLVIPFNEVDKSQVRMQQALAGFNTRTMFPAEIRERLDLEGLSEKEMTKLEDWYGRNQPAVGANANPFGGGTQSLGQMLQLINSVSEASPKKVTEMTNDDLDHVVTRFGDGLLKVLEQGV